MGSRDGNAGFGQTFLQSFLFFTAFRRFLTNYSKKRFSRLESSLFFSEIAGITVHQALSGQRRNEGQVMTKLQGITEMLGVFPGLGIKRRSRRLSLEELRLVERYRELSENDRIAMRYLVDAMRRVSQF
jgi:hypothetical protein